MTNRKVLDKRGRYVTSKVVLARAVWRRLQIAAIEENSTSRALCEWLVEHGLTQRSKAKQRKRAAHKTRLRRIA